MGESHHCIPDSSGLANARAVAFANNNRANEELSHQTMSSPSVWNSALLINGAMLVWSQVSATLKAQSCASLQRFGVMNENWGSVPFARSVANWAKGTYAFQVLPAATSSRTMLSLETVPVNLSLLMIVSPTHVERIRGDHGGARSRTRDYGVTAQ